ATSVGIPMPRLTSIPDFSSSAIRLAMIDCASIASSICDKIVNERCRGNYVVWRNKADGDNVFGCHDSCIRGHRDDRVEIAGCQSVREISKIVRKKSIDEREVGVQCGFEEIALPI